MKKTIVLFSAFALVGLSSFAQTKEAKRDVQQATSQSIQATPRQAAAATPVAQQAATPATPAQNPDLSIKFNKDEHNFGNVPEGPSVTYNFEFKNIGKTPIIFSDVHGSCGCTTPVWPKEPILPGKSSKIEVTYSTQGRVGQINKTVTVTSNVGTKILRISGNVDKVDSPAAPVPAVPAKPAH